MIECIIIIYANNKHGVKNELDAVLDKNCVEEYIRQECFYQSDLIVVKLFHIFNKIESLLKFFIHKHVVGCRHVCYLHKL